MKDFFNNQRILDIIWKRKIHFVIIGILAIALSAFFSSSSFITPKFDSTARIYPTNNIFSFSEESRTEQLLEVVNSRDIKLKMFDAFDLAKVYHVDRNDPHYLADMMDIYNSNVSASRTEFETVEIKVRDEDPQRASDMCDSIIAFLNDKEGAMHSAKYRENARIAGNYLKEKEHQLDSISGLLQQLRNKTGIVDFQAQAKELIRGYMTALASNEAQTTDEREIKARLGDLVSNGIDAYTLEKRFSLVTNAVDSLQRIQEVSLVDANKHITYCHIVETPIPADKKSYPIRWLIVAFSLISALFLGLLVFLILDYTNQA